MAQNWAEFQILCSNCLGTGLVTPPHDIQNPAPPQVPCPSCDGEGYKPHARVKIKAIMDAIEELAQ